MFLCSGAGAAQPPSEGVLRGNEIKQGVWRGLSVPYMRFWPSRARVWFPAVAKVQLRLDTGSGHVAARSWRSATRHAGRGRWCVGVRRGGVLVMAHGIH